MTSPDDEAGDMAAAVYLADGDLRAAARTLAQTRPVGNMGLEMATAWWLRKLKGNQHV